MRLGIDLIGKSLPPYGSILPSQFCYSYAPISDCATICVSHKLGSSLFSVDESEDPEKASVSLADVHHRDTEAQRDFDIMK
jgi:hypothetical protein